ncbi:MAG: hypothetical protein ABSA21_01030, partial [Candidatus Limnocylindrales bacterium]
AQLSGGPSGSPDGPLPFSESNPATEPPAIPSGQTSGENAVARPFIAPFRRGQRRPTAGRRSITMGRQILTAFGEWSVSYDVVGKMGRVTADITPGHLGEVLIEVRQGTERFLASAADPEATIKKNTQVLVVGSLGGRTVEVAPTDTARLPR